MVTYDSIIVEQWRKQSDLLGIHDSSYTHSQSHGGDLGEVVTKETSIGNNGVFS